MNLDATLTLLARDPSLPVDLCELALHLARTEYPALDVEAYLSVLEGMAHEARARVRGDLRQQVRGLCRYLFHEMGFRGNESNYYDPRNSYLNEVLDRRLGIPISLSVVVMGVGNRVGLDVVGVGLPGHFVVKAVLGRQEVLFDPFHDGRVLSPSQCERLVYEVTGIPFDACPETLAAVPPGVIVQRMLTNLKAVYLSTGDFVRAISVIERLRLLRPEVILEQRDLGVTMLRADRPGEAINHLEAYLVAVPEAPDANAVRQLLNQARTEVARWN